jgi:hypothetical protein
MNPEKREAITIGAISGLVALFFCILGIRLFYLAANGQTYGITLFGLTLEGKTLAATVAWIGFIILFYSVRKITKYLSNKTSS